VTTVNSLTALAFPLPLFSQWRPLLLEETKCCLLFSVASKNAEFLIKYKLGHHLFNCCFVFNLLFAIVFYSSPFSFHLLADIQLIAVKRSLTQENVN